MPLTTDTIEELDRLLDIFFEKIGRKERLRKQILKLTDECEAYLYPKVRDWMQLSRKQIIRDIKNRILKFEKKSKSQIIVDYVDWETIEKEGESIIKPAYLNIMEKSGNLSLAQAKIEASFDVINPRSVTWAEKYSSELVTLVGKNTKAGLRTIVSYGLKKGKTLTKIAREIEDMGIGLNGPQTRALIKYGDLLYDQGLTGRAHLEKYNKYYDRLQRDRSKLIARTEVNRSVNEGYLDSLEGTRYEEVEISSAGDACHLCLDMAGIKYSRAEARGRLPVHPNCYDDKTEVYTDKGWMLFKDLYGNEKILSLNPNTFDLEWLPYTTKISYYYEGKLYHFKNNWFSLQVTPNHNQLFGTRFDPKDRKKIKWRIGSVENIIKRGEFIFPRTANWKGKKSRYINIDNLKIKAELFCKLMGYYLSEGSVTQRYKDKGWEWYQIKISQNPEGLNKIYEDIKELPVKLAKGKCGITCNDKILSRYLLQFGHSDKKYIPKEIKQLDSELIRIFLDAFNFGDGSRRINDWHGNDKTFSSEEKVFFTSSRKMAGDIGELILKSGGYPSYHIDRVKGKLNKFRNGIYKINNNLYRISWNRTKNIHFDKRKKKDFIKEIDYKGHVYDVELPRNHILWVKHEGKTCWSGNCRCHWIVVVPSRVKKPKVPRKPEVKPPGWRPAKTKNEAYSFAHKELVKEFGLVDYGKMDLKGINIINKELFRLIEKYKIKLSNLGSSQGMSRTVTYLYGKTTPNSTFANLFFNRPTGQISMTFNEYWWATPAKRKFFKDSMYACVRSGYHKLDTFKGVVAHEYGHVLDILDATRRVSDTSEVMLYLRETDVIAIKNIFGDYANKERAEFFAEAFCNYEAKNLPKKEMSFVAKILKKYILR